MSASAKPPALDAELLEQCRAQVRMQLGVIMAFLPEIGTDAVAKLGEALARQQLTIAQNIFPTLIEEDAVADAPFVQVVVSHKESTEEVAFPAYKRIGMLEVGDNPRLAIASAMFLAFLTSPAARGLLLAHGFEFRFEQVRNKSKFEL